MFKNKQNSSVRNLEQHRTVLRIKFLCFGGTVHKTEFVDFISNGTNRDYRSTITNGLNAEEWAEDKNLTLMRHSKQPA